MVVLGITSNGIYLAAYQFRWDWATDPAQMVAGGSTSAELLKWAALTDLFSFYLPMGVVALALFRALRGRGPTLALGAMVAANSYVVAGSIAAASLAFAGPSLMHAYAQPGSDRAAVAIVFATLVDVVYHAIWQLVDAVFLGFSMIATGWLIGADQRWFSTLSIGLGCLFWLSAGLNVLGVGLVLDPLLVVVLGVWIVWAGWLAMLVASRRPPFGDLAFRHSP
jgi:hypothetical protein